MTTTAIALFCGAGGASLGLHEAGLKTLLAVDSWKVACETYTANFPDAEVLCAKVEDIDPATLPRADFIWGSPPCPDFSVANTKRDPKRGMVLVRRFLRIVEAVRPRWWCMENVIGVLDHLEPNGHRVAVLDAADYGAPQQRRRAFVGRYLVPRPTHGPKWQMTLDGETLRPWVTVRQALGLDGLLGNGWGDYRTTEAPSFTVRQEESQFRIVPYPHRRDWRNVPKKGRQIDRPAYALDSGGVLLVDGMNAGGARSADAPAYTIRADGTRHGLFGLDERRRIEDFSRPAKTLCMGGNTTTSRGGCRPPWVAVQGPGTRGRTNAVPLDPDSPAPAVLDGHHDKLEPLPGYRRLTVEECAILQGFPTTFVFTGSMTARYKQVGNAVPPPVARAIAEATAREQGFNTSDAYLPVVRRVVTPTP